MNEGSVQVTDVAITEVRGLKPQMRYPARIAVYLKPSNSHDWRWSPSDKQVMDQWIAALKKEGIASEVFPIPEMLAGRGDTRELRYAAAQCGADAVFIIQGAAETDSYKNFASVFNLTLIGGYLVPGSHKDSLFIMEGILLDVDNGYIYTGVQAEGIGKVIGPTFVVEEKDSVTLAKTKAVTQFSEEVVKRMRAMALAQALPATPPAAPAGSQQPSSPSLSPSHSQGPVADRKKEPTQPNGHTSEKPASEKPTGLMTGLAPVGFTSQPVPVPMLVTPPTSGSFITGITPSKSESK
jgi:hypothetical protein